LAPKNRSAARRAIRSIRQGVRLLARHPEIGRPLDELPPEFRKWFIPFGGSGYVALCRFDGALITILAVRYAKEAGY
jgi:plasmid stabilization system protein ParE